MIRFQRVGRKNDPAFRIVVTERRSKPKGAGVETLGSYHPKTNATVLENERILYWLSKGAKLSATVHNLLVSKGVIQGAKINVVPLSRKTGEEPATPEGGLSTPTEKQAESSFPQGEEPDEKPAEKETRG
ncbi:MAG: 30S ribosomal protein S16 [Candidatus Sungbacteria bacterium RIFCSPHIGHO2_02_FULL_47_11]|uniref:30S ribosomal protein S16 n=1 Tax=Candidatus Sungbacteria bacterium RIFCSPHIGHO2_02_FULL_47_11 TaxID=1802270 RepID=A0A1G2KKZ4_9BACT|nr:MAG: 30S ribosomal protein S16 [Candidatus Sungbacteria bacterium RIFCSPHIGHO2_02_FULL_47_11]